MNKFFWGFLLFCITCLSTLADDMRFIQVDGLYYQANNENSNIKFTTLIDKINKEKNVDFVVFSGNNIAKANPKNLEEFLKTAKRLNTPYYVIIGNKDVNKQKDLGKKEYTELLSKKVKAHKKIKTPNYTFIKKNTAFIVVDGSKEFLPSSIGYYRPETLNWLDEQLNLFSDKNVVILQHFPLIPPSARESHYTYKADEYLKLLSKHKNIKALISGHFNANSEKTYEGIIHISTKEAPVYRVIDILDYDSENPVFWSTIKE